MFHVKRRCAGLFLLALGPLATMAQEPVVVPGPGVALAGLLYRPAGPGPHPAVVLMHGCSGMWAASGKPTRSYQDWAKRLQARGFVALLLDSFGPRGAREICTQKERIVSEVRDRPRDAYAALAWLAGREDVRPAEVHLLGWSNGGSAVLHAARPDAPGRIAGGPEFRSAVAFYPGCGSRLLRDFRPIVPLLIQAGGADDWTPARHCAALAKHAAAYGSAVEIDVYPDAHHAFDRVGGKVRHRPDVRNSSSPSGWGATVGPHPEAREKTLRRTLDFLESGR